MKKLFFTLIAWLFVFALMLPLQNQAATITVTNGNDDGAGSLRAAIAGAMAGDVIDFSGVTTVTLTSDQLFISTNLTINGGTGVTITRDAGAPNFRIFNITSGSAVVEFNKLTITNGKAIPPDGNQAAGIQNSGTLTLNDCTIANNESGFQSGGIQNDKTLTMNRCFVHSNSAPFSGSGLLIYGSSTTTLNNCVFTNNQGNYAIDIQSAATLNITNCTIAKNTGGINVGSGSAVVTLKNTIVAENTVNIQNNVNASSAYNLIGTEGGNGGLTNGTNNNIVGISPRFANSSDPNGADDKFGTADDGLMLTACNLATNVGNNADAPSGTDIAGNTRIFNTTVDIGAYEFQANSSPNPTITLGAIPAILAGATSFTISYTATSSPTTYSILGTGITTVTDVPLSSPLTVNLSPAASINIDFTLTVKNANGCISNAVAGYVVVNTPITQACATATFNGTAPIAPTATTAGVGGRGGIHTYTVPAGVTAIRLDAKGAKGGSSPITGGGTYLGGQGGWVQATYAVTPGDVLYILVGGKGGNGSPDDGITGRTASGGGGATVVSKGPIGSGTLLLVAGGGGGAGHLGGGGNSNNAPNSGSGFNGAGGASFSVDGGNSNTSDDCGKGGQALNAGGYGGANTCFRPETNGGGYGGGGAGNYNTGNGNAGGGGGGGYVGGNAGATAGGNGGSSFTDASATDVTTNNHSDDNGSVVIYAVAGTHQMTWTGAVNTDWNTPCNWSPSGIPTATNDVVIPNTTNKPTINTAAVAQTVEVQAGATLTIAATKSLTINGSRVIASFDVGFHNSGTVQNNGQLVLGNTGSVGIYGIINFATFNNNTDGEITIDRTTNIGLLNDIGSIFTNNAKITIGATASVGDNGLLNQGTFNNNTGGEIKIDQSSYTGMQNLTGGNFTNAAKITIGALAAVGDRGLVNSEGTFTNTTGGDISVRSSRERGLLNTDGGTFVNVAKITVDGSAYGIHNHNGSFQNNTNGEIKVDNSLRMGVLNEQGTFTNLAKISINVLDNSTDGLVNKDVFNNSAAGMLEIDGASGTYLVNQRGTFTNAAQIKLGGLSATEAINGIRNEDLFNNNLGGEITITNAEDGFVNSETLTNNALITITSSGMVDRHGFRNNDLVTNNACGRIILLKGMLLNRPANTFTNRGLVQVTDNLTNEGIFTNNGVLKYGSLTGTVTNSTSPSLIINNTPTPIFTYGGTYDGVINGIFTDANATVSAGMFSAPNTFTPSGLPVGTQTLYAKITPVGGACSYVVAFTYNVVGAPIFTTHPSNITLCSGGATSFTVAATNANSYQWQLNTGSGWSNVPAAFPYANGTTATLNISNVAGLNGNQYRCVATSVGGNTNSNAATLTVLAKPTVTLMALGQTFNEGNTPTLCDTDANSVNSLQLTVNNSCIVGSPVWRVQAGSGAWSDWSANTPSSQPSDNTAYRYQAACDVNCPSTYTTAIALIINYRASTPQNVSLVADATTVAAGESKSVCNIEGNTITFNATCAAGEIILYSVDGADYSNTIPSQIVDGNFHNYRVRCRKADGTPSCVETESAVISLKINNIAAAPTASISPANGCGTPTAFSGNATCGSLTTIWYNAATNQALPTLPAQTPNETTSYYARCQTEVSVGETGCLSEKSNVVTFTLTPVNEAPIVTASAEVVCTGTLVTVSANCPAGSNAFWNTGVTTNSFQVAFSNITQQTYWARCIFTNGCQSTESSHKTIAWKTFELTLINIGQSKSAIKPLNDKAAWASQFITPDAGPMLDLSTEANPTIYHSENVNKTGPRYWTIQVETCALGTDGSVTYDMLAAPEVGIKQSFNTHENNAPYFMYANRAGFTELYAQNHPAYGFYQDNGSGGNVYDAGLPKGLYKLSIRYWDQKGQGSIYPSTRQPAGNILAYQEYWFRIQSKDGIGVGAAKVGSQFTVSSLQLVENPFAEIAPNPVSNTLRLKVAEAKDQKVNISLVDASGRTLLQRAFVPQTNQHQEEFEVSDLANGMYFLKVNAGEKQATLKVVKVQ